MTRRIVLASGNKGKVKEIQDILRDKDIEVVPQSEFGVAEAEETGLSFVENAIIKARNAAAHTGLAAIADDSGLSVDYLKGEPGVYSARYAGPQCDDEQNNQLLLKNLTGVATELRTARFQCAIVYMAHDKDPMPLIAQASWEGRIVEQPGGSNGFGYDPLFWVPTHNCTSAQLSPEVKNSISHRGQALRKFIELFKGF